MNRMFLEREEDAVTSYLIDDDGKALEIRQDPFEGGPLPGDLYKARILRILPGLNAAFARFTDDLNGYLPLDSLERAFYFHKSASGSLSCGDELLVQVRKLPVGEKLTALTGKISLVGTYTVLDAGNPVGGVSSKIKGERSAALGALADELSDGEAGVVIRTAAADADEQVIAREAALLRERLDAILEKAEHASCPSCQYKQPEGWISRILAVPPGELEAIITDDEELYKRAETALPEDRKALLRLYEEKRQTMRDCYRLGRERERASSRKIWLSSGAFLVIEPTEALTAIDVNSGKAVRAAGGMNKEAYFLKLNKEAAKESAAQIRLRNLSGIIIVDFINMEEEASRTELMRFLQKQLDPDPVKCCAVDMTKLHLAEIARQRKDPPLKLGRNEHPKEDEYEE